MKKESQNLLTEMGKRIVAKRNELGLSQETLAELAGISPKTISSAELGQKALRPENIIAVSHALGLDVEYLLTGQYSRRSIFEDSKFEHLDTEKLNALKAIIDAFLSVC